MFSNEPPCFTEHWPVLQPFKRVDGQLVRVSVTEKLPVLRVCGLDDGVGEKVGGHKEAKGQGEEDLGHVIDVL